MNARTFLARAWMLEQQVQSGLEQMEALKSLATRVNFALDRDRVKTSPDPSAMADWVHRLIEAEEELNRKIDTLVDARMEIAEVIGKVEDPLQRLILEKRHLTYMSWREIAWGLHYTKRWLLKLYSNALEAVQQVLDRQEEEEEKRRCFS